MKPEPGPTTRYAVAEQLGEGGMGTVHAALDRSIGREIAIKRMRIGGPARTRLERRFLREARVQACLEHPAIVPVYDLGRDADGAPYFSMKQIRGATLEAVLQHLRAGDAPEVDSRHTPHKLLTAFVSVCEAVRFAHTRGIVHRDLKPANIMLGAYGEVYVLDWGIAALLDVRDDDALAENIVSAGLPKDLGGLLYTMTGETVGTPGYLAPEQARGGPSTAAPTSTRSARSSSRSCRWNACTRA